MIQFSESYNAQTIFDQVWEAPYEWFRSVDDKLPARVHEIDEDGHVIETYLVTVDMLEEAVIKYYMEFVANNPNPKYKPATMASYLEDMDANDVDSILQLACFKEIRYS